MTINRSGAQPFTPGAGGYFTGHVRMDAPFTGSCASGGDGMEPLADAQDVLGARR